MPLFATKTFVAGSVLPASDLNSFVTAPLLELRGGGFAITGQTALGVLAGSTSTQVEMVTGVTPGHALRVNDDGTDLEFGEVETFSPGDPVRIAMGL